MTSFNKVVVFLTLIGMSQLVVSEVPGPPGLISCKPDDPFTAMLARSASSYGTLKGCFISEEKAQIEGKDKVIMQPLEIAFVIALPLRKTTPVTAADVDAMYLETKKQWSNIDQTWQKNRSNYEKQMNAMVKNVFSEKPSDPGTPMSMDKPLLVSIDRLSPESYTVVSIRRRSIAMAGDNFLTTRAEGIGFAAVEGRFIRLTITRELRQSSDIESVKTDIAFWTRSLSKKKILN